ncbi:UDP-N-acetylmuramoyl-L-alanine--D-glutamate ligase [Candidatus Omnitrophota bacterium]
MKNTERFKNLRVTVVGLARSGLACAGLLQELGAEVCVTEQSDNEITRANKSRLKIKDIRVEIGAHSKGSIEGSELVVVSPGVSDDALPILWADQSGIPVVSEIEIGAALSPAEIIAVTGSNGKTTVTTLLGDSLKRSGRRAFICGNIGNPFCGEVAKMKEGDFVSLEVSSFQLERIRDFKPKISVMLNFSRNHLDRYAGMQEYLSAKKRIFINQDKDDYLVLNQEDASLRQLAEEAGARVVYFSGNKTRNPNQAAVITVSDLLGLDHEAVAEALDEFKGIEHRLEEVREVKGVRFINDSKSTTVNSTIWALKYTPGPIILIAGGKDKGLDYTPIRSYLGKKVKEVVLIGEAAPKIRQALIGAGTIEGAKSMEEAVRIAFKRSEPGGRVLLSPMCSSFDMFKDYEDRGREFKKRVQDLDKVD